MQIKKYEDYIAKNGARASTANSAKSRQKMLDRIEKIELPKNIAKPTFQFTSLPVPTQRTLVVRICIIGYSDPLLPKMNFHMALTGRRWSFWI